MSLSSVSSRPMDWMIMLSARAGLNLTLHRENAWPRPSCDCSSVPPPSSGTKDAMCCFAPRMSSRTTSSLRHSQPVASAIALPRSGSTTPSLKDAFFFFFALIAGRYCSRKSRSRSGTLCSATALMFSSAISADENAWNALSLTIRENADGSAMAFCSSGDSDATSSSSTTSKSA